MMMMMMIGRRIAAEAAVSAAERAVQMSDRDVVSRSRATQLPVAHQNRHRHAPRPRGESRQLQRLVLPLPLALVPPVLEPDFNLRGGEFQRAGQLLSLLAGQVALLPEAPLQLRHLRLGEEDPGLPAGSGSGFYTSVTVR